jgi:hypothetical protein
MEGIVEFTVEMFFRPLEQFSLRSSGKIAHSSTMRRLAVDEVRRRRLPEYADEEGE